MAWRMSPSDGRAVTKSGDRGAPALRRSGAGVADTETTAVSENASGIDPKASRAEVIGAIEDPIVRRLVRLSVHVRGYLPYYVATIALFAFLAFGPRPGAQPSTTDFGADAAAAGVGGTRGAAPVRGGSAQGAATTPSPALADAIAAGPLTATAFDGAAADAAVNAALSGDTAAATLPEAPAAPAAPDAEVPEFDPGEFGGGDFEDDDTSDGPEACTVALPSPAPAVTPSREAEGLQTTAEAAAGTEFPADAAPYAEDAATTAGCPSVGADAPNLPVPIGLPV